MTSASGRYLLDSTSRASQREKAAREGQVTTVMPGNIVPDKTIRVHARMTKSSYFLIRLAGLPGQYGTILFKVRSDANT